MGIFDRVRQTFRGKTTPTQPDEVKDVEAARMPEQVSISPLPQSIKGMEKGRDIDRLGMMKAEHIGFAPSFGPDQKGFWEYKEQRTGGHSKADYLEMASYIPEVRERLNNGESLQSLMQDARVGACATQYFSPENMIKVESYPDGHYEYSTGGRHRIAAAQELGIEIPVQINEYGNKDGYSISPWEKQERYDALMDYMEKHNYSESNKGVYEADPEWQRLNKDYNHPVNAWEHQELNDWEKSADSILLQRYEEMHSANPNDAYEAITTSTASQGSQQTESAQGYSQAISLGDRYQSAYADRIRQTPSLESNRWAGERGESVCAPQSDAARQILEARGISGVAYQNGVPDFSPFSESTVKLGYMTDARHSSGLEDGRDSKNTVYAHFEDGELVSSSHHADKGSIADLNMKYNKPGNFEQADVLTAEQWTADGKDGKEWTADDVAQYRKDNGLTWHECNDMETMQMVPEAINADFGHLGGVAEVKEQHRIIDEVLRQENDGDLLDGDDFNRMSKEELSAFKREAGYYDEEGVWRPDDSAADGNTEVAADEQVDKQMAEPIDDSGDVTYAEPVDDSGDVIYAEPVDNRGDVTYAEPIDDSSDVTFAEPIDDSSDITFVGTIDDGVDAQTIDSSLSKLSEETVENTIDGALMQPIDEPVEDPIDDPIDEPVEELVDDPIDEPVEEPVDDPIDEPVEEPIDDPIDEPVEEPVDDPIDGPVEEPVDEPIDEPVEEPAEEPMDDFSDVDEFSDTPYITDDYTDLSDEDGDIPDEETDSFDDLSDEEAVDGYDTSEDFSDLSDDVNDDFLDDSDYSDYSDDVVDEPMDSADYSDISDDVDSGSYDDSAFDSGDVSVDSGDSGSFDGGGDTID